MFRAPSEHPRRAAAALIGFAGLAAACADTGDPGVEVQALQADVVFGVDLPEAEDPVLPVVQQVPVAQPAAPAFDDGGLTVPFRNEIPERFQGLPFRAPPPVVSECPDASVGASPEAAAGEEVTVLPTEGQSAWKRSLTVTQTVEGVEISVPLTGFETRILRAVEELGAGTDPLGEGVQFTYETVAPDGFGNAVVRTYRVNTDPLERTQSSNVDTQGAVDNVEAAAEGAGAPGDVPDDAEEALPNPNTIRVGEPNRGLVLLSEQVFDGNGQPIGSFSPSPPVLLLPLPIEVGDTWQSVGIDSTTGQVMRVDGRLNERQAVDACGDLLDGWKAELDVTNSARGATATRDADVIVSTDRGATIIGEFFTEETVNPSGGVVTVEGAFNIAQVQPDPIPAEAGPS